MGDHSGEGLTRLREFCEAGGGKLAILSGGAYVAFRSGNEPLSVDFRAGFPGTLVNIQFDTRCGLAAPAQVEIQW